MDQTAPNSQARPIAGLSNPLPPVYLVAALLVYTISVYTSLAERLEFLAAVRHELIIGAVLAVMCIWVLTALPVNMAPSRWTILAIVLLFLVMLSQIPFAADPVRAWDTFFNKIFKQALFAFFILVLIRSPQHLRWFLAALVFSLFWVYQEAIRGLITGDLIWANQGIPRLHGSVDLYRHPNGLSLIAVASLPFIINLLPVLKRKWTKLFLLGTAALALPCILYSGSRAGYLGTLAVLFVWWAQSPKKIRGVVLVGVALLAAVLFLPDEYKGRFMTIGEETQEDSSKEARERLIRYAWEMFQENPFGVGVDGFLVLLRQRIGDLAQPTHNLYLQVATHLGIQGFMIFFFFVWALFSSFKQTLKTMANIQAMLARAGKQVQDISLPGRRQLSQIATDLRYVTAVTKAARMYLIMLLVNGMFNHSLYQMPWWLTCGLAVSLANISRIMENNSRVTISSHLALATSREAGGPAPERVGET
jgi:putative inorganic carbon (HCO3(-)) transporter